MLCCCNHDIHTKVTENYTRSNGKYPHTETPIQPVGWMYYHRLHTIEISCFWLLFNFHKNKVTFMQYNKVSSIYLNLISNHLLLRSHCMLHVTRVTIYFALWNLRLRSSFAILPSVTGCLLHSVNCSLGISSLNRTALCDLETLDNKHTVTELNLPEERSSRTTQLQ